MAEEEVEKRDAERRGEEIPLTGLCTHTARYILQIDIFFAARGIARRTKEEAGVNEE